MGLISKAQRKQTIDLTYELKSEDFNGVFEKERTRMLIPEWFPQSGVQIVWPTAETDWNYMLDEVTEVYIRMAYEIAVRERLVVVTSEPDMVRATLAKHLPKKALDNVTIVQSEINDTWARDTGFLSVKTPAGIELMDFGFNGWGGKFDAAKDNAINRGLFMKDVFAGEYADCNDFILEGGSIEADENATLLTTESCLLTPTRNSALVKPRIEQKLREYFNVKNILWLKSGRLDGDDTDGHVDTLARLCPHGRIAYVKCYDERDSHFESLNAMENELKAFVQPTGEPYELIPLPLPAPVYAVADDGESEERLPATYANYLVINGAVLMPTYAQPDNDAQAIEAIQTAYPNRTVVPVHCTPLLRQHGSLHCSTMQFPAKVIK